MNRTSTISVGVALAFSFAFALAARGAADLSRNAAQAGSLPLDAGQSSEPIAFGEIPVFPWESAHDSTAQAPAREPSIRLSDASRLAVVVGVDARPTLEDLERAAEDARRLASTFLENNDAEPPYLLLVPEEDSRIPSR